MTGFGAARIETDLLSLHIQIKSVNGRFLETRFRLPKAYQFLENELKKEISAVLRRGSVDISINRLSKSSNSGQVQANRALAESWLRAARLLAQDLKFDPREIKFDTLLRVPDVMGVADESEAVSDQEKADLLKVFSQALKECFKERQREGSEQYKTFSNLLDGIEKFLKTAELKKEVIDSQLEKALSERINTLSKDVSIDPSRLAQEALILRDRADIAEELARAQAHLKAYRVALKETGALGKKLEFYTQELHREINTMGSKTQNLSLVLDIIEAKSALERLREQVQNVE